MITRTSIDKKRKKKEKKRKKKTIEVLFAFEFISVDRNGGTRRNNESVNMAARFRDFEIFRFISFRTRGENSKPPPFERQRRSNQRTIITRDSNEKKKKREREIERQNRRKKGRVSLAVSFSSHIARILFFFYFVFHYSALAVGRGRSR